MNRSYCDLKCPIGSKASAEFLANNNSAYDAAMDFMDFTDRCFETCPYKEMHVEQKTKEKQMTVCCISAKARHGKDTAAEIIKEYLEQRGQRVLIAHFADLLKFICKQFFGWDGNKDEAGRTMLQYVGTDVIGAKRADYWAEFIVGFLKMFKDEWDYVLIPDCRYPIEVYTVKQSFNTVVLRVERPNFESNLTDVQKQHASEVSMDDYNFDVRLVNDGGLDEFKVKLEQFAEKYLLN